MKTPFFSVSSNKSRLKEVSSSWVGTPFHSRSAVKGGGIDCVSLVFEICVELGVVQRDQFMIPHGLTNWNKHNNHSLLDQFFRSDRVKGLLKRKDVEDGIMIGDLVPLKTDKSVHHLAMAIDEDHLIHCHRKKGVMTVSIADVEKFLTNSIYRIYTK